MNPSFGELRSILHNPPSAKNWRRLLWVLESMEHLDAPPESVVSYCRNKLDAWPASIDKPLPYHWAFDPKTSHLLQNTHPAMELGDTFYLPAGTLPPKHSPLFRALTEAPWLRQIKTLHFHEHTKIGPRGLIDLAHSPNLHHLEELKLPNLAVSPGSMAQFVTHATLPQLRNLTGGLTPTTGEAFKLLARSNALPKLERHVCNLGGLDPMDLHDCFGPARFPSLTHFSLFIDQPGPLIHNLSKHHSPWRSLHLATRQMMTDDLQLLGERDSFQSLEELTLRNTTLWARDALNFLCVGGLGKLHTLNLTEVQLTTDAWSLMMEHATLPSLKHLDLSLMRGPDTMRADLPERFARNKLLGQLETLWLDYTELSADLLRLLLTHTVNLRSLSLSEALNSKAAIDVCLGQLPSLKQIECLDLSYNSLPPKTMMRLLEQTAPLQLKELHLHHNTRVFDDWVEQLLALQPRLHTLSLDVSALTPRAIKHWEAASHHGALSHLILHQKFRPKPFEPEQLEALKASGMKVEWRN